MSFVLADMLQEFSFTFHILAERQSHVVLRLRNGILLEGSEA